jgi:hypothetical protein
MGLREKHSAYRIPLILFFNEDPHLILKFRDPEKNIWGWFSAPPDCPSNARCSSESMRGTMNCFEKGNPRPFQGGEEVSEGYIEEKSN